MNDKKTNINNEGEVVAQYLCGSTRDCCLDNPYCSRIVVYNSKGKKIVDECAVCQQ